MSVVTKQIEALQRFRTEGAPWAVPDPGVSVVSSGILVYSCYNIATRNY